MKFLIQVLRVMSRRVALCFAKVNMSIQSRRKFTSEYRFCVSSSANLRRLDLTLPKDAAHPDRNFAHDGDGSDDVVRMTSRRHPVLLDR